MTRVRFVTKDGNMEHDDFHQSLAVPESIRKEWQDKQYIIRCHNKEIRRWLYEKHRRTGTTLFWALEFLSITRNLQPAAWRPAVWLEASDTTQFGSVSNSLFSLSNLKIDGKKIAVFIQPCHLSCHSLLTHWPRTTSWRCSTCWKNGNLAHKSELYIVSV